MKKHKTQKNSQWTPSIPYKDQQKYSHFQGYKKKKSYPQDKPLQNGQKTLF